MPLPAQIQLDALALPTGLEFVSSDLSANNLGFSVAFIGDINNDGFEDMALGAPGVSGGVGTVFVLFGGVGGFTSDTDVGGASAASGFTFVGVNNDRTGFSVRGLGDINGDGIDDFAIGSPGADPNGTFNAGQAMVVFGTTTGFGATMSVADLNGTRGFTLSSAFNNGAIGEQVSGIGDFNGDGRNDFLVTGSQGSSGPGVAYVVYGRSSGFSADLNLDSMTSADGLRINGALTGARFGYAAAGAGDINGDGLADVVIGAHRSIPAGAESGRAYVIFGTNSGAASLSVASMTATDGFTVSGTASGQRVGYAVSGVGDVNGDGFDDVAIGAPGGNFNGLGAAAFIIFGKDTAVSGGFGSSVSLASLNGTTGFAIQRSVDLGIGQRIAAAGDVNGDGVDDILLSSETFGGVSFVVYGKTTGFSASIDIFGAPASTASWFYTGNSSDNVGVGIAGGADVNGDGLNDILVGATERNSFNGAAFLIFGQQGALTIVGGNGDDTQVGNTAGDNLSGGGGKDTLSGLGGDDVLDGGDGNDVLDGGDGADDLVGGLGNDVLNGGAGNDVLSDASGSNKLNGGDGNDQLFGASGADRLNGENDDDILEGGSGNDYLDGGTGANTMSGGIGNDVYILRSLADTVFEAGGEGTDTVRAMVSYSLTDGDNIEVLELLTGLNLNATGNSGANTLRGNNGDNTLSGGGGSDKLDGGAGADILLGGIGRDQLTGGAGADTFRVLQESLDATPLEIDTVLDYELGVDTIDFSQIDADVRAVPEAAGDQGFTLSTTGLHRIAGELFVFYTASGDVTTVRLDIDGDGVADYQMAIHGNVVADSGNWLL